MAYSDPDQLVADLLAIEPPKTWSLIATIFGDFSGTELSGKELGAILRRAQVKPQAQRVALHRLKKDGWIVSQKSGREVVYSLSARGQEETRLAQRDIYRDDTKFPNGWEVAILPPDYGGADLPDDTIALRAMVYLVPCGIGRTLDQSWRLMIAPSAPPDWLMERLVSPPQMLRARRVIALAEHYLDGFDQSHDHQLIRLLFLHFWRKLALRRYVWAHISLQPEGEMAIYHKKIIEIFQRTQAYRP